MCSTSIKLIILILIIFSTVLDVMMDGGALACGGSGSQPNYKIPTLFVYFVGLYHPYNTLISMNFKSLLIL